MGSYMVNIISNICVPDDETGATCTTMVDAYRIQFIVDPCQVDMIQATQSFSQIVYNIGAPDLTSGKYAFSQQPECNYE